MELRRTNCSTHQTQTFLPTKSSSSFLERGSMSHKRAPCEDQGKTRTLRFYENRAAIIRLLCREFPAVVGRMIAEYSSLSYWEAVRPEDCQPQLVSLFSRWD